jgi:hypothetical protein
MWLCNYKPEQQVYQKATTEDLAKKREKFIRGDDDDDGGGGCAEKGIMARNAEEDALRAKNFRHRDKPDSDSDSDSSSTGENSDGGKKSKSGPKGNRRDKQRKKDKKEKKKKHKKDKKKDKKRKRKDDSSDSDDNGSKKKPKPVLGWLDKAKQKLKTGLKGQNNLGPTVECKFDPAPEPTVCEVPPPPPAPAPRHPPPPRPLPCLTPSDWVIPSMQGDIFIDNMNLVKWRKKCEADLQMARFVAHKKEKRRESARR